MKLLSKVKQAIEVKAYKVLFKRELKKYNDKKVISMYGDIVKYMNGQIKSSLPRWKLLIARDVLVKEVKKRHLL